jgi:predicted nucleic acid-binding protein
MIHLDTNVLIALPRLAKHRHALTQRIARGEPAATSALAWFEYVCGPVGESERELVRAAIGSRILEVDEAVAERAAMLFNRAGRSRHLRTDSLIAATALAAGAELASYNARDFALFVPEGLSLLVL